jgi:hypothetical protein
MDYVAVLPSPASTHLLIHSCNKAQYTAYAHVVASTQHFRLQKIPVDLQLPSEHADPQI